MAVLESLASGSTDRARPEVVELRGRLATTWRVAQVRGLELERRRVALNLTFDELRDLVAEATAIVKRPRVTVLEPRRRRGRCVTLEPGRETARLSGLHVKYASTRDPRAREQLVEAYDVFAGAIARSFPTRRESPDDLLQVARLGLLLSIDRFDPARGRPFKNFARLTIMGELKRHVRDRTWAVHVGRSAQDRFLVTVRAVEDLTQELRRSPRIPEVARHTGLSEEHVIEAMELGDRHKPISLDAPAGPDSTDRRFEPGEPDAAIERIERDDMLSWAMCRLSPDEREVVRLRFVEELTQSEIAARVGTSQMKVSRVLAHALRRMRALIADRA